MTMPIGNDTNAMALNPYQSIVGLDDIPDEKLRDVVHAILQHLELEIVEESTPDYTVYEVRKATGATR